jgi:hypothetical protein
MRKELHKLVSMYIGAIATVDGSLPMSWGASTCVVGIILGHQHRRNRNALGQ